MIVKVVPDTAEAAPPPAEKKAAQLAPVPAEKRAAVVVKPLP